MNFRDLLASKIIVGDGALGTRIYQKGIPLGTCYEELNLSNPFLVKKIHTEYLDAGAELIETNTFQANRVSLKKFNLDGRVRELNEAACKIASGLKKAVRRQFFIAGSIGPLSQLKETDLDADEIADVFSEQAGALLESGVDLIIFETFTHLREIRPAIEAARKLSAEIPIIAQLTYFKKMARGVREAVKVLEGIGADVIGVNCRGPAECREVVSELASCTKLPISAFPNAGLPQYSDGRYMYLTTPEYFLATAREMIKHGANIVGGCCGTDHTHIKLLAEKLGAAAPPPRKVKARIALSTGSLAGGKSGAEPVTVEPRRGAGEKETKVAGLKDKDVCSVIVEVDPPRDLAVTKRIKLVKRLRSLGVDAITVGDNPLAVVRLGNLSFARRIEDLGIPTVVHISCRDKNLIALQSTIMEAHHLGIRALLPITGDPAKIGDQPNASSVYDLNSFELIRLIRGFNNGYNFTGDAMSEKTRFVIGTAFNINKKHLDDELKRLARKIENGADFALTQPCYDKRTIETAFARFDKLFPSFPVYLGLLPITNFRNALYLANEVPGITIPDSLLKRLSSIPEERQSEASLEDLYGIMEHAYAITKKFYFILPLKSRILFDALKYLNARAGVRKS